MGRRKRHWPKGACAMSQVTKRALEQSLKNLLLKKPLTKITVGEIAEDCGINRMTSLPKQSCSAKPRNLFRSNNMVDTGPILLHILLPFFPSRLPSALIWSGYGRNRL